jgi:putative ABC transport system permease protein
MLGVVLGAIRARRAQAATLFVLTALALIAATAAPWYVVAAARSVALADVAVAPASQRVVLVAGRVAPAPGVVDQIESQAGAVFPIPGSDSTVSVRVPGRAVRGGAESAVALAYRDKVCDHVAIAGACPSRPGEVLLSEQGAGALGAGIGDEIDFVVPGLPVMRLRIAGTYQMLDPLGPYWAGNVLGRGSGSVTSSLSGDPLFAVIDTVNATGAGELFADYHQVLPPEAYLGIGGYDLADEIARKKAASGSNWRVETQANALTTRVAREQRLVNLGVGVAAAQLLVLCWFALFFAVRHTAEQRRPDIGLLKLRGSNRWRVWSLTAQQSVLPMVAGAVVGAAAGLGLARLLGGELGDPDRVRLAGLMSLAAVGAAGLGALAAAIAADWRGIGSGVIDLLRHVPPRRRGWRAGVVDLIIAVVAAAGVYQAYAIDAKPGDASGLVLVAPALVALAVALLAARAVGPLAARAARKALRAGRVPLALAATHLARRPGTHRVFALLTVAVALLASAAGGWYSGDAARDARATHEVGADRVLTVKARSRAHLLNAVRAADPQGTHAMAVVRNRAGEGGRWVLAVDSPRLARVASWHKGYADTPSSVAQWLRPEAPAPVRLSDGPLTLEAEPVGVGKPLLVRAHLVTGTGEPVSVEFGPLRDGRQRYQMELDACGGESGCRLVGLEVTAPNAQGAPPPDRAVRLHSLAGAAGPVAELADPTRWRAGVRAEVVGPTIVGDAGGLLLTTPPRAADLRVQHSGIAYLVDAPVPLPVAHVGVAVADGQPGDPRLALFGSLPLPVLFTGHQGLVAVPQAPGRAYLVDLEYADRVSPEAGLNDETQVWLAPGTPASVLDGLRDQGLTVLAEDSIAAARGRYDEQGPPLATRFQVLAGIIGLLLAAGVLTVAAAVERPDRAAELAALRRQGMDLRSVRLIGYGGYAALVGACVVVGVAATALAGVLVEAAVPVFVDNWGVLPVHTGPAPVPLIAAGVAALVVLGATGAVAAAQLVRAVRS